MNAEVSSFFPFDPYRLPRSGVYIQDVYREWSAVAIDDDEDEDEEEDEDEDEEEEDGIEGTDEESQSQSHDAGGTRFLSIPRPDGVVVDEGLGASLGAMSISPARHSLMPGVIPMSVS